MENSKDIEDWVGLWELMVNSRGVVTMENEGRVSI